ncbi:MAG TPA: hypothetical protein VH681_02765 [Nitrospiraceae bacterium]|jgi:hypothetical protein|nr:hypothetical protein [Nitrospira sp.]
MSDDTDTTKKIVETVSRFPNSDLENVLEACSDLTWNQVFLELDRLSRSGQIVLQQIGPGRYSVAPGPGATTNVHSLEEVESCLH